MYRHVLCADCGLECRCYLFIGGFGDACTPKLSTFGKRSRLARRALLDGLRCRCRLPGRSFALADDEEEEVEEEYTLDHAAPPKYEEEDEDEEAAPSKGKVQAKSRKK